MDQDTKISIIVPVYQVEPYLKRCIDSILAQSHQNFELILIDDGSPDHCGAICDAYSFLDIRIKVIHQENKGVSSARNAGLDIASGDYIGFIDSDDYIEPDMYETLLTAIRKTGADIACISMIDHHLNGSDTVPAEEDTLHVYTSEQAIRNMFLNINSTSGHLCNKIYKAELFDGLRLDSTIKIREDALIMWDLFYRSNRIAFQRKNKYHYMHYPTSAIGGFAPGFLTSRAACLALLEKTHKVFPEIEQYAQAYLIGADFQIIRKMVEHNCFNRKTYDQLCQEIKANMTKKVRCLLKKKNRKMRILRYLMLNHIYLFMLVKKIRSVQLRPRYSTAVKKK